MYYRDDKDYDGVFETFGGFGNEEYGAAGTIYRHMISDNITRRSLYVNNNGHAPQTKQVNQVAVLYNHVTLYFYFWM